MYNPSLGRLTLPTKDVTIGKWRSLRLHQGWGEHDLAEIRISQPVGDKVLATGTPLQMTYGIPGHQRSWTGYIHTPERVTSGQVTDTVLMCLGPTYSLSGSDQASWTNVTGAAIVEQVCAAQGLAVHATPTQRVYEHLTQAGMTGWELINRLGHENGRFVIADGVGVRFLSREDILSTFNTATCLTFTALKDRRSQVISWHPSNSDDPGDMPERTAVKSFAGVDARRGHVVRHVQDSASAPFGSISGRKVFVDSKTNVTVTSAAEAEALHRAASDLSSWKYRLKAVVRGTSELEPGLVVRTFNMDIYSGAWVVQNVIHIIEGGVYTCAVGLATDALGELPRQYRNGGSIVRPLVKATPVLRSAVKADAFATSQTRWQALNRVPLRTFASRPTPSGSTVRRASRA